ncbi:unnamed protein product [Nezara viridula]|uniref:Peroxisomal multifunctional enzyme type 2 n=1 Tax=Nezara viridula TaxID=85310 RepID=A0A9P0MRM3_NEZVI|nr:unnamed protein product [Nezara viridula]
MIRFDDKVAVVTGAGAGLGRAYALLLAERGAKVVVNDLGGSTRGDGSSTNAADTVVEEIKKKGGIAAADYNSVVDGDKIIKTALENFGKVDIVINNAGILRDKTFSRISDSDWDLVHNVHVRGAFKVTQAAWENFRKQKYGRVVFTASNAGLLGNFGQANYSAAKMALVGLCNTLAIEGAKYNIHSNVIVPTAASRLTENILPPDFFEQLKPELIAPVVTWLCHEDCEENGSIIESAAGWASKQIIVRGKGSVLRRSLADPVSIEDVREKWDKVVNVEKIDYLGSIQEETANLTKYFSEMDGSLDEADEENDFSDKYSATFKECITFALGIGASVKNPGDLKYLYEGHENFTALPTQLIMPALMATMTSSKILNAIPNKSYDLSQILHGEQYLEVYKPLPLNEELRSTIDIIEVLDKGKNAVIISGSKTYDKNDELVSYNEIASIVVNGGGFGGPKNATKTKLTEEHPKRSPDATMVEGTSASQAALYRLSGDLNPLHIDPNFALLGGFKEPILHGLASLGFAVRHVLLRYADNDPSLFKAVKVRFVKPVLPGDSLKTSMWRQGNRIYFQTEAVKAKNIVISGAYVDLHNVIDKKLSPPPSGGHTLFNSPGFVDAIQEKLYLTQNLRDISYNCLLEVDDCGRKNSWIIHNGHISKIFPSDCKDYDVVLKINDSDLTSMLSGKLSYRDAERCGAVNVEGDEHLAAMILQLVTPKTKL